MKGINFLKKRSWLIVFCMLLGIANALQAQFENYGNLHIYASGTLKVYGSVVNTGAQATINNSGNLLLTQNFTNNGNDLNAAGTGTVTFNGSTTQNINGAQSSTFYNLSKPDSNDIIIANNEVVGNALTLTAGTFSLNNHTLTLNGAYSGAGTLTGSAASGLIIGGQAGTISFTTGSTNNYLNLLTVNTSSGATLADSLNINAGNAFGTVTVNGTLNTNNNLTLKSDADGTARVAESYGTISGNVTSEQYIPPKRAWRFINVPFSSSTQTIKAAWQENVNNTDLVYADNLNPHPGYGTHITGNNNTLLGYDYNTTENPSLKIWQNNTWSATEPATGNDLITKYPAYCLFVRGSRAVNLSEGLYATPDATTLRAAGVLNEPGTNNNQISQSYTGNAEDYIFVGNPYASTINLTNVLTRSTGIHPNKFWLWDPKLSGSYNVGGYVTYSDGVYAPAGSGSYPTGSTNLPVIQSSQAFIVQSSDANASVNFAEPDKTVAEMNVFGRISLQQNPTVVYTNLMVPSGDSLVLADGVAAGFGNRFSAAVDADDASKLWNFDENMALVRNTSRLEIEFRPVPVLTDTLFFKLYLRQEPYVLQLFSQNATTGFPQAWLVDQYLDTRTPVNLSDTTLYSFTPNTDTNSYRNRFILVFKRVLTATPVAANPFSIGAETATLAGKVEVYPNPVITGEKVLLKFNGMPQGIYEVTVSSLEGKDLTKETIQHKGGNDNYNLQLGARWATGSYLVTVTGKNGYKATAKLIIGK